MKLLFLGTSIGIERKSAIHSLPAAVIAPSLFRLRLDNYVTEEGAINTTEAAEHFWREPDDLLLAGQVFGRNAAPKSIALFLSMPMEVPKHNRNACTHDSCGTTSRGCRVCRAPLRRAAWPR